MSGMAENVTHLLALALRLEDEGQYNIAKLMRAQADSICRAAAWKARGAAVAKALAADVKRLAEESVHADPAWRKAVRAGADALEQGRVPLFTDTPDIFVCRSCGHLAMNSAPDRCPTCAAHSTVFQWFPPVHWLAGLDPAAALQRLRQTPQELAAMLEGLTEAQMSAPAPDGGWGVRNVISHLRDAQAVCAERVEIFRSQAQPVLESKMVWTWAKDEAARPPTTAEVFAAYRKSREDMLHVLEAIPLKEWWKTGKHQEFGTLSMKQQVGYFALHELSHIAQLEDLRRQLRKS